MVRPSKQLSQVVYVRANASLVRALDLRTDAERRKGRKVSRSDVAREIIAAALGLVLVACGGGPALSVEDSHSSYHCVASAPDAGPCIADFMGMPGGNCVENCDDAGCELLRINPERSGYELVATCAPQ